MAISRHSLVWLVVAGCAEAYNVINLDSTTLPLLVARDLPAFVRFDKEHSYGEKADIFNTLAANAAGERILIGDVGIGTYGEKLNQDLAEKYGYKEKDKELESYKMDRVFPKFRLFPANGAEDMEYSGDVTVEAMTAFIKQHTGLALQTKEQPDTSHSRAQKNVVSLDDATFPLVVGGSLPCFVRFDKDYSHGPAADAFKQLAETAAGARLLVGSFGVQAGSQGKRAYPILEKYDYKEKGKELQYNDLEKLFPKFRFYPANGGQDFAYTGEMTADAMSQFLKTEAKIYFGLKGALREFDMLASEFVKAADKADVVNRAATAAAATEEADRDAAAYYVRQMRFAREKGAEWFKTEYDRIQWILANTKLVAEQRDHFTLRANRLTSFISPMDEF